MNIGNREDLFWLRPSGGEPGTILSMSAGDLERPDVLQIFLELAEQGQFRLVVDTSIAPHRILIPDRKTTKKRPISD